ncbi:ABC transporter permease [Hydrogenophaga sp.]|uniref:ABC transporter permease n=1 Tax=Hydrogenophaga sp. TaxID=1904254 RepID=UPI0027200873|nr:ABC transporter permease [Hydrogenophaga sp.]MDO9434204.1 ABC transporter permease [Hydrogenophaga sp.]
MNTNSKRLRDKKRMKVYQAFMPWVCTAAVLIIWQVISRLLGDASLMLPAPSDIGAALIAHHEVVWHNAWYTLATTLVGFAAALVGGVLIGLAIGASPLVYSGLYPLLVAFNAVPKVALVPIFVLWFGIGAVPAAIMAFALAVFPIIVNVATGLATIDPETEDVMRSLGATRYEILTKVGIPRMLPYLFASLKIAITLAFVGAVISETVASNNGIGFLMQAAAARFDVALVFAGLVVVAGLAVIAYAVCAAIEGRMTKWAVRGQRR